MIKTYLRSYQIWQRQMMAAKAKGNDFPELPAELKEKMGVGLDETKLLDLERSEGVHEYLEATGKPDTDGKTRRENKTRFASDQASHSIVRLNGSIKDLEMKGVSWLHDEASPEDKRLEGVHINPATKAAEVPPATAGEGGDVPEPELKAKKAEVFTETPEIELPPLPDASEANKKKGEFLQDHVLKILLTPDTQYGLTNKDNMALRSEVMSYLGHTQPEFLASLFMRIEDRGDAAAIAKGANGQPMTVDEQKNGLIRLCQEAFQGTEALGEMRASIIENCCENGEAMNRGRSAVLLSELSISKGKRDEAAVKN
jgi:hypothetical protein